jgi:hypothetical protein
MGLYTKSISEIVAAKIQKGQEPVEKAPSKKELAKAEREQVKEAKRVAKEAEKEAKHVAKEAKVKAKETVKESNKVPKMKCGGEERSEESVGDGETAVEMEVDVEEVEEQPAPKIKTLKTVKVKKARNPPVTKKTAADVGKPPAWFVKYTKEMEAARGVTDKETVKESAQAKWQEKGMPKRVATERENHVSKMYGMMFGN